MNFLKRFFIPIALVIGLFLGYKVYRWIFSEGVSLPNGQKEYELIIPSGWDYTKVGQKLLEAGILEDPKAFDFVAKKMSYPDHVKSGRYALTDGMSNRELVQMLRAGKQTPVKFTFNTARTKAELVEKIRGKFEFNADELLALMNDANFLKEYGLTPETSIAFFIPNTYEIYWNTTPKKFFERMRGEYNRFWTQTRNAKREKIGLTRLEIVTIASIVEQETTNDSEKSRIAGVYLNRIRDKWKLEADPTVKFALQNFGLTRIFQSHIQQAADSPYNTYTQDGIPPGPICAPSTTTIDAVLNYEKHDYMFFCANPDMTQSHVFSKTLDAHNKVAKEYQAALTEWQRTHPKQETK